MYVLTERNLLAVINGNMNETNHVDDKTRNNLAYIWSFAVIIFVGYIIVRFGEYKEILTLIIGFITGVAGTILALYFGGVLNNKNTAKPGQAEINITASTEPKNDGTE